MLLVGQQEGHPACKIWVVGCCLERGADLHMAQLLPLSLTVSCFSKTQIGFTFLVPAHPGSPGQRAIKQMCVYTAVDNERLDAVIRCLGLRVYCHFMFAWRRRVAVSVCLSVCRKDNKKFVSSSKKTTSSHADAKQKTTRLRHTSWLTLP